MKRVNLTQEGKKTSQWFDEDSATHYSEDTEWNGNNHISLATGSQTEHEALYITKKNVFILNCWSQWQGTRTTYEIISKEEGLDWMVRNGHEEEAEEFQAGLLESLEV